MRARLKGPVCRGGGRAVSCGATMAKNRLPSHYSTAVPESQGTFEIDLASGGAGPDAAGGVGLPATAGVVEWLSDRVASPQRWSLGRRRDLEADGKPHKEAKSLRRGIANPMVGVAQSVRAPDCGYLR